MQRLLVAFEAPPDPEGSIYEEAWDGFVSNLAELGLALVSDLDPVDVFTATLAGSPTIEVYEVERTSVTTPLDSTDPLPTVIGGVGFYTIAILLAALGIHDHFADVAPAAARIAGML